jgi:hypothetical protein
VWLKQQSQFQHKEIMMDAIFTDKVEGQVESARATISGFLIYSRWTFECYDKHGNLKWEERDRPNLVTHEGLDDMLSVYLDNATQSATWYVAPVNTNTAAAATMTYAVPVFTEDTDYDELVRQTYTGVVLNQVITNTAAKATFTITTGGQTLYGGMLCNKSAKGDTAGGGKLFCYSLFSSGKAVEAGDTFKITIQVTAAHA